MGNFISKKVGDFHTKDNTFIKTKLQTTQPINLLTYQSINLSTNQLPPIVNSPTFSPLPPTIYLFFNIQSVLLVKI